MEISMSILRAHMDSWSQPYQQRSPRVSPSNYTPPSKALRPGMGDEENPACLGRFLRFKVSTSGLTPRKTVRFANERTNG